MFVEEGEKYDSVAASMSLRSISWKVGQVVGPVGVGLIKDFVSVQAAFYTAAGFIVVASGVFWVVFTRAAAAEEGDPPQATVDPGD